MIGRPLATIQLNMCVCEEREQAEGSGGMSLEHSIGHDIRNEWMESETEDRTL